MMKSRFAYREDFIISTFITLLVELSVPVFVYLIYKTGATFKGWNLYEVMLLQGIFLMAKGFAYLFIFGLIWDVNERTRSGSLDLILIKPRSFILLCIIEGFDMEDAGKLFGGILLFVLALYNLPSFEIIAVFQFILLFIISVLFLFGFALIIASFCIVFIDNTRVFEVFYSVLNFGMYPAGIFSKHVQAIITFIIPVTFIGFYPASVLLGRPTISILYPVIVCIILNIAGLLILKTNLKKYSSAGG
jgi:ABC-2 type transport system permease protein